MSMPGGLPESTSLSEPDRAGTSPRTKPTVGAVRDNAKLYRVSFEESLRALEQQREELSAIRQRAVQYLALVVTATAFLVGSTLTRSAETRTRDGLFFGLAGVGTGLMALAIIVTAVLLWPKYTKLRVRSSARKIVENLIDPEVPASSEGLLLRRLSLFNDDDKDFNDRVLKRVRYTYVVCIVIGALQVGSWVLLVWLRA